ncbi:MAG: CIA30 family protein [Bacteroidota bacterium]
MKVGLIVLLLAYSFTQSTLKIDFGKDKTGQSWQVINDGVMGGLSKGEVRMKDNSVLFEGNVSLKNYGGFTAFKSPFQTIDLSDYEYISIRLKTKGQRLAFTLETEEDFYKPYYKKAIPSISEDWETIKLELSTFKELQLGQQTGKTLSKEELKKIVRIGLITNEKKEGAFEVEVDYILFE